MRVQNFTTRIDAAVMAMLIGCVWCLVVGWCNISLLVSVWFGCVVLVWWCGGVKSLKLFEILTPIRHRVETWTDSIQELLRNISSGVEKRLQNSYMRNGILKLLHTVFEMMPN